VGERFGRAVDPAGELDGEAGGAGADVAVVLLGAALGEESGAVDGKAAIGTFAVNQSSGGDEIELSLFGGDAAEAGDLRGTGTPGRHDGVHSVVDDLYGSAVTAPRGGCELAIGDHGGTRAPERPAGEAAERARGEETVGMEDHGDIEPREGGGGQDAGAIDVDEIHVAGHTGELSGKAGSAGEETGKVGGGLAARGVGSALDRFRGIADGGDPAEQGAAAGESDPHIPSAIAESGQEFDQGLLGAAEVAELVEDQELHARTAIASTKK